MIAATFKRRWPTDRLERLRSLQTQAKGAGLRLVAKSAPQMPRGAWLPYITFWQGTTLLSGHFDIAEAEAWLNGRSAT